MSLDAVMDAVAVRGATLDGMKGCFSVGSGSQGADVYPRGVDDWPVGFVWPDGGELTPGSVETLLHHLELVIWANASNVAAAMQALVPFVERCRVLFRTDLDAAGTACRVLMTGYRPIEVDEAHGKPFLVLPIALEALELETTSAYAL